MDGIGSHAADDTTVRSRRATSRTRKALRGDQPHYCNGNCDSSMKKTSHWCPSRSAMPRWYMKP